MPRSLSTTGKDLVPIVQEAGWATWLVWTGAENLALLVVVILFSAYHFLSRTAQNACMVWQKLARRFQ
jgi:hypothetical protein